MQKKFYIKKLFAYQIQEFGNYRFVIVITVGKKILAIKISSFKQI